LTTHRFISDRENIQPFS